VNSLPPERDPPDDIDALYRRWSSADSARPSSAAAKAILANAAAMASSSTQRSMQQRAARRRRSYVFAGLAAATLASLWVTPLLFRPRPVVSALTTNTDASVRQSAAPAAKDAVAPLARYQAAPAPAPAPAAPAAAAPSAELPSLASTASSAVWDAKRLEGGRASDLATNRAARPALSEAESIDPNVALRHAATLGDEAGVSALLDQQIDVNHRDSAGKTPLMLAVIAGHDNIVAMLIAHGADPNAGDANGETPLHAALTARHPRIAAALRRAGAR
jgi:hypothetical protein